MSAGDRCSCAQCVDIDAMTVALLQSFPPAGAPTSQQRRGTEALESLEADAQPLAYGRIS